MTSSALRLLVYDRTCARRGVGLSTVWATGAALYRRLGRVDAIHGASSWRDALSWLASHGSGRAVGEIQFWGHGRWGKVLIGRDALDIAALRSDGHALHPGVLAVRDRLVPDGAALVWLRTCEAFGADAGIDFAQALADRLGARAAGHTFIIGAVQSGLRALAPGCRPTWSASEGLAEGTPVAPRRAFRSGLTHPRTISFLDGRFPAAWFDEDGVPTSR